MPIMFNLWRSPKFMEIVNMKVFMPKPENLQYGISPLYARIRIFEFVLKLAHRMAFKKWKVRNENDKSDLIAKTSKIMERNGTSCG